MPAETKHVVLEMEAETTENPETTENADNTKKIKIKSAVLDSFTRLTKGEEPQRVKSSAALLKYLAENQNDEHEIKYMINRLIRGLGASKIPMRAGFFATLVAILSSSSDITVEQIFEIVNKDLHTGGSNSKGENADILAGQILVCGAIIHSKTFLKTTLEEQQKIIEMLCSAGKKRSYLQLAAYSFIIDLFKDVNKKQFKKIIWPKIQVEVLKPFSEQNLDTLYILLNVTKTFPSVANKELLQEHVGSEELICEDSMKYILDILINIPIIKSIKHPIYEYLVKDIATTNHLPAFIEALDTYLAKPSYNKHLTITSIFNIIAQNAEDSAIIPQLFTKHFMIQTMLYFKTKSNKRDDLHVTIHQLFKTTCTALQKDTATTSSKLAVIKKLLFWPGSFIFEKFTSTKLVQQIIGTLNGKGVKKLAEVYKEVLLNTKEQVRAEKVSEKWMNSDRLYAAHFIIKLLGHSTMQTDAEFRLEQLKFFIDISLFKCDDNDIGSDLAAQLRMAFFRSLDRKLPKLDDLCATLSQLVNYLNSEMKAGKPLLQPLDRETGEIWDKTVKILDKLEGKSKKKKLTTVFRTMFLLLGLQLLQNTTLASDSLKELFSCYERLKADKKKDGKEAEDDDPLWIEVVVDLFLNLLSHNSHLLRNMIKCVFPHLCEHINATAIHQILSVLDPKDEDNPLIGGADDESGDSDSDVEADNKNSDESEESDEDLEENETVNDKLRLAVQQALGADTCQTDEESVDVDAMSEGEGEKLDVALAQAFRQFKPNVGKKSKKQTREQQALTHFRVRALDLIEIYVESTPSMILVLEILLPLLELLEFTIREEHQKPLQDRIKTCLRKLSNLKKFSSVEDVTESIISDFLKSLMDKGTKNVNMMQEMDENMAGACMFVLRCVQFLNASESYPKKSKKKLKRAVSEILQCELTSFFKKRDCLVPYVLFKEIMQQSWESNCDLMPLLIQYAFDEEIRLFRRSQALQLLKLIYTKNRLISSITDSQQETILQISYKTISLLTNLSQNPADCKVSEKFIASLFNVLSAVKCCPIDSNNVNFAQIGELVMNYRSRIKMSKDTLTAYKHLCKNLGIQKTVQLNKTLLTLKPKDNKEGESEDDSKTPKPQERKPQGSNKQKLKKEARLARLQSMSDGFKSSISFADANLNGNEMQIDEDEKSGEETMVIKENSENDANNSIISESATKRKLKKSKKQVTETVVEVAEENGQQIDKKKRSKNKEEPAESPAPKRKKGNK